MYNKYLSVAAALLICLLCSACGLYNKDYYSESDYQIEQRIEPLSAETVTVSNASELETAVISIIEGKTSSHKLIFSTDYEGDPSGDISSACKSIITRNPLCAYCVESIDYDLYKVLAYYEAELKIHFAESAIQIDDVVRLSYSGALRNIISQALASGDKRIAVLVSRSAYDSDDIIEIAQDIYYKSPLCVPCEPKFTVNMFSGVASQRLYEINIDYVVSESELKEYQSFVADLSSFKLNDNQEGSLSELDTCAQIVSYLVTNCSVRIESGRSSAYYALSKGYSDSKGLSLAFIALCEMNGIESRLVIGQRDWENHYWNIVRIDGDYYHVDIERCINEDIRSGFLLNDDNMWQSYRWNLSGYPQCSGSLTYNQARFYESTVPEPDEIDELIEE